VQWDVERRRARLRVWNDASGPLGEGVAGIAVEWAGDRPGHHNSYGLLGGRESQADQPHLVEAVAYTASLAGRCDDVVFGLAEEYRGVVLAEFGSRLQVVVAAHGQLGSSQRAFQRLARMVCVLAPMTRAALAGADLWALWDATA
jgi:hypothetical protein